MMLHDRINIEDVMEPRLTKDGYLVATAKVARTGIQNYRAGELGMDGDPNRIIKVFRPAEEVFASDAMSSYAYRPVTVGHPDQLVDAENWRQLSRGQTGGEVLRDKEFVQVPMVLMDADAINEWKQGTRELSMGYTMDLDTTPGKTPEGEQYDAVQRKLRMNHLALVPRARGGSQLRLGDEIDEGVNDMTDVKLTTITVDGLSVQTTDAGAQAIAKLSKELSDAREAKTKANDEHVDAIKAKDKEMAEKDAELEKLKKAQVSDEDLDKRVKDRADLIATAKMIADVDYSGKSDADIRKTAVVAVLSADAIKDKSDDYVAARFDILAEDANKDPVRKVIDGKVTTAIKTADDAYDAMVQHNLDAWKGEKKEAH